MKADAEAEAEAVVVRTGKSSKNGLNGTLAGMEVERRKIVVGRGCRCGCRWLEQGSDTTCFLERAGVGGQVWKVSVRSILGKRDEASIGRLEDCERSAVGAADSVSSDPRSTFRAVGQVPGGIDG